jgi:hypothetical protein
MSRFTRLIVVASLTLGGLAATATGALAAKPEIEHSGRYTETFFDGFILDLCGIETMTTVTERWTSTHYADGSERFQLSRKFVPADPRIPIEYGAGMSFWDADGVQTVHGSPLRLQRRGEGIIMLDAGFITLSDDPTIHGPHPFLDADLVEAYCPREDE